MAPRAKKTPAGKTQTSSVTTPKAPAPVEFTKEQELHAYREMLMIRRFEEKAGQLYGMGFIGGFCHLYIGQEAVVVGMQTALKEGDQIITSYRDHGHMLATGMEARGVMAELTGRLVRAVLHVCIVGRPLPKWVSRRCRTELSASRSDRGGASSTASAHPRSGKDRACERSSRGTVTRASAASP